MTSSKIAYTIGIVGYEDGSIKEKINFTKGSEKILASLIFSLMTGNIATNIMNYIEKNNPEEYLEIKSHVEEMYNVFLEELEEITKAEANLPVIKSSQVFGR